MIIDGKKTAAELREELKKKVAELKSIYNVVPGLTVILVGEDPASKIYVKNKEKFAKEVGMDSEVIRYPADLKEEELLNKIRRFLPNLGTLDISPVILLLLIWFIEMCMKLYIAPMIF